MVVQYPELGAVWCLENITQLPLRETHFLTVG